MADFVQVMKDWRRMCETIQSGNQEKQQSSWCKGCPLQGRCIIDTDIKNTSDAMFAAIRCLIQKWVTENPEPVYPSWKEYFATLYGAGLFGEPLMAIQKICEEQIPTDIAEKLGLKPKE